MVRAIFTEPLMPARTLRGKITHPGYEHLTMDITIERMEPERVFALRWHPGAVEPGEDLSDEPTTLVVFELAEVPGGTLLDLGRVWLRSHPAGARAKAFRVNEEGWAAQMKAIEEHLDRVS